MNTMAKTTGASKPFFNMYPSLALQNVYIQLCIHNSAWSHDAVPL